MSRDVLCRLGCVWCQTFGHLDAGHATMHVLARRFRGEGRSDGGLGGQVVLGRDHPYFRLFCAEMRRTHDPDGAGPELMTGLRFLLPWMDSDDEVVAYLRALHTMCTDCGRELPPTVADLRAALVRGGFMEPPQSADGPNTMDSATTDAVRMFQRAKGLKVDGIVGVKTWAALRDAGLAPD